MQCFYWESSVEELRRRTSIGDLGAANTLAGRLLDEGVNTGLVVTTIAQMISKPISSNSDKTGGNQLLEIANPSVIS